MPHQGLPKRAGEATAPKLEVWQKPASHWPRGPAAPSPPPDHPGDAERHSIASNWQRGGGRKSRGRVAWPKAPPGGNCHCESRGHGGGTPLGTKAPMGGPGLTGACTFRPRRPPSALHLLLSVPGRGPGRLWEHPSPADPPYSCPHSPSCSAGQAHCPGDRHTCRGLQG